jgi:uncharacterized protein DUF2071
MRVPVIRGIIDRRILANYRVDPEIIRRILPAPFEPHLAGGFAIAGVCLIRLKQIRPKFMRWRMGISSENAAHRIAVEWVADGQRKSGVYIPRRDTDSRLNALAGGRLFPGRHHHAYFRVDETDDRLAVEMRSDDGESRVTIGGQLAERLPEASIFDSLQQASDFFVGGSLGYSETDQPGHFDGLELRCQSWHVTPLSVERIESSFFDNPRRFPEGSIEFDCALVMRGIDHEWRAREDLCCAETAAVP